MRPHRTESGVFNTGRRKCRGLLLVGARADRGPLRSPCVRPSPPRPGARQGRSCAQGGSQTRGTRDNVPWRVSSRCFSEPCGDVGISDHALDELGERLVHDPLEVVDGREDPAAAVLGPDTVRDLLLRRDRAVGRIEPNDALMWAEFVKRASVEKFLSSPPNAYPVTEESPARNSRSATACAGTPRARNPAASASTSVGMTGFSAKTVERRLPYPPYTPPTR